MAKKIEAGKAIQNQDEFSLYRLRREAESLVKRAGQPSDYVVLGAIPTLLNYPNKVRDTFNQAISLFPTEQQLYVNYSVSLSHLGVKTKKVMDFSDVRDDPKN